jgi:succinate dehydrogenase hydrophobic anchor subunit
MSAPLTSLQREGLASIRRLQRQWLAMLVAGLALFLLSIVLIALDFSHLDRPTVTELHLASWEMFLFLAALIVVAASTYVALAIRVRRCPRCGEHFFIRSRRKRTAVRGEPFPAGPLRQQCRNCGLSLGEVAVDSALQNP